MAVFITQSFFWILRVLGGIACFGRVLPQRHKGAKFFLLTMPAFQKGTKLGFLSFGWVLAKTPGRKVFLFLPDNDNFFWKRIPIAPIEVEILLLFVLKSKRLKRIAGNSSLYLNSNFWKSKFQILNFKMLRLWPRIFLLIYSTISLLIYVYKKQTRQL